MKLRFYIDSPTKGKHEEFLNLPDRYVAGHKLTAEEADALNKYLKELVSNWSRRPNGRRLLERAFHEGSPLQPIIDQHVANFRFGEGKATGGMSELEQLVRRKAKAQSLIEFPVKEVTQKTFNEQTWQENTKRVDLNKEARDKRFEELRTSTDLRDACRAEIRDLENLVDAVNQPPRKRKGKQ